MLDRAEDPAAVWQQALELLRQRLSKPAFESWLKPTRAVAIEDGTLVIGVSSTFARDWLERRATQPVRQALAELALPLEVKFVVFQLPLPLAEGERPAPARARRRQEPAEVDEFAGTPLNPRYTFASFVVGRSNQLAQAAAMAVAKRLGDCYNPLFIYGGAGLGKTHLMQAIGQEALRLQPGLNVAYISGDEFTYHVVNSIKDNRYPAFRRRYRNVDVWLVDDIQFIAAKERTEGEFFQAFNALYETNKQIVITSDQPPKELQLLDDRLRSRFESGLIADIKPPDLETRIAILSKKAEREEVRVPEEVINYIANIVHSNVRVLEGALIKVVAAASATGEPITLPMAMEQLKDHSVGGLSRPMDLRTLQEVVASHFHLSLPELTAPRRTQGVVVPRQIAMYLARELLKCSYPEIARAFGGRDHTTVMHAHRKITRELASDTSIRVLVVDLAAKLGMGLR